MLVIESCELEGVSGGASNGPAIRVIVPLGGGPIKKPPTPGDRVIDNNTDKPIVYPK